jgi:guanylate kinase
MTENNKDKKSVNGISENGKLVVISGFAGSGKGAVLKELRKIAKYKYSVSATTRHPRSGETHGVDYYFLSEEEFREKINNGELLEYVEYSGNYYGTLREPVMETLESGDNIIFEIEVEGAVNIKEKFHDALMIFITPPTYRELEKRLRNRGTETEEIILRRLEISKKEINYLNKYDYFVINEVNKQKEVAFAINAIINGEDGDFFRYKIDEEKIEKFIKAYFAECTEAKI